MKPLLSCIGGGLVGVAITACLLAVPEVLIGLIWMIVLLCICAIAAWCIAGFVEMFSRSVR